MSSQKKSSSCSSNILNAVALEALVASTGEAADGASNLVADPTNSSADTLSCLANGIAEALSSRVEAVAEPLCSLADGTGDTSEETALTLCLLASGQDVVDTTEKATEKTAVVRHCEDWVG
jgi:hypothetical protein